MENHVPAIKKTGRDKMGKSDRETLNSKLTDLHISDCSKASVSVQMLNVIVGWVTKQNK